MNKCEEKFLLEHKLLIPDIDYDLINYRSPIEILQSQMQMQFDDNIMNAVYKTGINVNKEELLKALKYDRNQYDLGYKAGCVHCRGQIMNIIAEYGSDMRTILMEKLSRIGLIEIE